MDGCGDLLIESLQRVGVDTPAVQREDMATNTAIIIVNSAGDNTIVMSLDANGTVDVSTMRRHQDVAGKTRILELCIGVGPGAVEIMTRITYGTGTRMVFSNSPFHPVLSAGLLEAIDIPVVSEHKLAGVLKSSASDTVAELKYEQADNVTGWVDYTRWLAAVGIPSTMVTLEGHRSMAVEGEEIAPVDPLPADVMGTTNVGDSFLGTLLAALAAGAGLKETAGAASATSAFTTTSVGTQTSYGGITVVGQHFG